LTVAPNSLASVFGTGLAAKTTQAKLDANGNLPVELEGTSVEINGVKAGLLFVSPGQINLLIPPATAVGEAQVSVKASNGTLLGTGTAAVHSTAPALFSLDASGRGAGAILDGATYQLEPFLVQTSGSAEDKRTRLLLYATGVRNAGAPAAPPANGNVASFVTVQARTNSGVSFDLPVEYAGPAPGFFGLDQINVVLPAELDGAGTINVTVTAGGAASNSVSAQIWFLGPPQIASFSPVSLKPGAVLTITGTGFATDMATTRNRIVLEAGNGLSATVLPLEADGTTLKTFVPALAKDAQSTWYQGPATLCVETDQKRACSAQPLTVEAPAAVSGNPGDLMIQFFEDSNQTVLSSISTWASAQQVSDFQTMSLQALQSLQRKIAAARSGAPQTTTVTLGDGQTVTVVFDVATIRKMEALISASQPYFSSAFVQPLAEQTRRLRASTAIDWNTEQQLTDAKTAHKLMDDMGRTLAVMQFVADGAALAGCLAVAPSCFALAAAVSTWSPVIASASLLQVAAVATIELGPNSLDSLTTTPSGSIELPVWSAQDLTVEGHFVATMDPTTAVKEVAKKILSRWVAAGLGLGFATSSLVENTLEPVIGLTADALLDLGLRDRLRIDTGTKTRDVSLSLNTVNSSCIHGSSPSEGMLWFLDTNWTMYAFQPMTTADRCDFWARDNVLWLRGSAAAASNTVQVKSDQPSTCAAFPTGKLVPFGTIYSVSAPIANGDRVVLGSQPQTSTSRNPFTVPVGGRNASLSLPRFANERYCGSVQFGAGCTADAYVPTASERGGDFTPFAGVLFNPFACRTVDGATVCDPFPGGIIPRPMMGPGGVYGWRVRSVQGCGQ
jgi:uncharacterized protein (TIGR03437 family)